MKKMMIQQAISKYGIISPVCQKKDFSECFTTEDGVLYFWFNTQDNSTHMIKETSCR